LGQRNPRRKKKITGWVGSQKRTKRKAVEEKAPVTAKKVGTSAPRTGNTGEQKKGRGPKSVSSSGSGFSEQNKGKWTNTFNRTGGGPSLVTPRQGFLRKKLEKGDRDGWWKGVKGVAQIPPLRRISCIGSRPGGAKNKARLRWAW